MLHKISGEYWSTSTRCYILGLAWIESHTGPHIPSGTLSCHCFSHHIFFCFPHLHAFSSSLLSNQWLLLRFPLYMTSLICFCGASVENPRFLFILWSHRPLFLFKSMKPHQCFFSPSAFIIQCFPLSSFTSFKITTGLPISEQQSGLQWVLASLRWVYVNTVVNLFWLMLRSKFCKRSHVTIAVKATTAPRFSSAQS